MGGQVAEFRKTELGEAEGGLGGKDRDKLVIQGISDTLRVSVKNTRFVKERGDTYGVRLAMFYVGPKAFGAIASGTRGRVRVKEQVVYIFPVGLPHGLLKDTLYLLVPSGCGGGGVALHKCKQAFPTSNKFTNRESDPG